MSDESLTVELVIPEAVINEPAAFSETDIAWMILPDVATAVINAVRRRRLGHE
jgi:hypothetical protein